MYLKSLHSTVICFPCSINRTKIVLLLWISSSLSPSVCILISPSPPATIFLSLRLLYLNARHGKVLLFLSNMIIKITCGPISFNILLFNYVREDGGGFNLCWQRCFYFWWKYGGGKIFQAHQTNGLLNISCSADAIVQVFRGNSAHNHIFFFYAGVVYICCVASCVCVCVCDS